MRIFCHSVNICPLLSKIKDISFEPFIDGDFEKSWQVFNNFLIEQKSICKNNQKFPKTYDFFYDVGWQIRQNLSNENNFVKKATQSKLNATLSTLNLSVLTPNGMASKRMPFVIGYSSYTFLTQFERTKNALLGPPTFSNLLSGKTQKCGPNINLTPGYKDTSTGVLGEKIQS